MMKLKKLLTSLSLLVIFIIPSVGYSYSLILKINIPSNISFDDTVCYTYWDYQYIKFFDDGDELLIKKYSDGDFVSFDYKMHISDIYEDGSFQSVILSQVFSEGHYDWGVHLNNEYDYELGWYDGEDILFKTFEQQGLTMRLYYEINGQEIPFSQANYEYLNNGKTLVAPKEGLKIKIVRASEETCNWIVGCYDLPTKKGSMHPGN